MTYDYDPELRLISEQGAEIAHAHVAQMCSSTAIRRMPSKLDGVYLFGMDTHFKIMTSFNEELSDSIVAVRQCEEREYTFRPENKWFMQFQWQSDYSNNASLLLFDNMDELISIAILKSKSQWRIDDNGIEIPIGVFLRRRGVPLALVSKVPFEITLSTTGSDNIGIKITIVNRSKKEQLLFWPDNAKKLLAFQDIYFDTFSKTTDLWEHYKKPVIRGKILKDDFRLFKPDEAISLTIPDLNEFYSQEAVAGEYSVRLHLRISAKEYLVPADEGDQGDCSVVMTVVDAWTGYLMSNVESLRIK